MRRYDSEERRHVNKAYLRSKAGREDFAEMADPEEFSVMAIELCLMAMGLKKERQKPAFVIVAGFCEMTGLEMDHIIEEARACVAAERALEPPPAKVEVFVPMRGNQLLKLEPWQARTVESATKILEEAAKGQEA